MEDRDSGRAGHPSAACQREDRSVYPITSKLTGGALDKVLNSLLARGLLEEVLTGRDQIVWRTDDDGSRFTLRATDAACDAIGIAESEGTTPREEAVKATQGRKRAGRAVKGKGRAPSAKAAKGGTPKAKRGTRTGTKQEKLVAMLRRKEGATVDEVVKALDWQPHSVRGAIAGALKKKLSLKIASEKVERRGRVYRIAD